MSSPNLATFAAGLSAGLSGALGRAIANRRPPAGLVFHSDRGVEYAAYEFRTPLAALGIRQSMNCPGSPVLIDERFGAGAQFGATGTPMAVLISADGRVASEVVAGADAVFALANR